jgi:hypothetical protein
VTNEPTNGLVQFYGTSSSCSISALNSTLNDTGDPGISFDDYKPWHDITISEATVGGDLAANTTYYYKLLSIDQAGNDAVSACLDVTTELTQEAVPILFNFTNGSNASDYLGNLQVLVDGQEITLGSSTEFNASNYTDVNVTFRNPNATNETNWSITLLGVDLTAASTFNLQQKITLHTLGWKMMIGLNLFRPWALTV